MLHGIDDDRDLGIQRIAPPGTHIIKMGHLADLIDVQWHSVNPDYFNSFRLAAQHLLKLGHRRIGLVMKPRRYAQRLGERAA